MDGEIGIRVAYKVKPVPPGSLRRWSCKLNIITTVVVPSVSDVNVILRYG